MDDVEVLRPGAELSQLKFDGFLDWFIHFTDVQTLWKLQPTYILAQTVYLLGGLLTFTHAVINKGRLPYLWLGLILHGIYVEVITYVLPDIDNFWHSQTPIIFIGRRLPLHIIFLYPCFIYNAQIAAAKLKLPKWAEPFLVGLLVVLIDIPYDVVSVRYAHWTWHDTDPNIDDRHYWVPWNSYFFHSTFAAGFTFWFHFLREKICNSGDRWVADKSIFKELLCTILPAVLGFPTGVIGFILIYHPLHDVYNIHGEVAYIILFVIFLLISWTGERLSAQREGAKNIVGKLHWSSYLTLFHLLAHYATFMSILIFFNPEDEISTGLKEPIGPCNEYVPLQTAFGITLKKRKWLCPTDYDEGYFDFHCIPNKKIPSDGSIWYTICGIPFENRAEYITIIGLACIMAVGVFGNLYFRSYGDAAFAKKVVLKDKNEMKKKRK